MKLYSTKNKNLNVSLKEAVLKGLAPDGGLFMPCEIHALNTGFFEKISSLSFQEIAFEVSQSLIGDDISPGDLHTIINEALNFEAPLIEITRGLYSLELFHGPTLAFKDFGARFMARLMSHFSQGSPITILVATSGDTGSAVAQGFVGVSGIRVVLLYPSGKVSKIQEQQLTTVDQNVTALEVDGTFDDCQKLVKEAFVDPSLASLNLSSANSINIARLIPQSFYYFYAYAQLQKIAPGSKAPIFSVPSGNFGNLSAGLIAKKMGLPVMHFIAATNANDTFTNYLETGRFTPKTSIKTISNAMDVGNPSNFDRILELYDHNLQTIRADISSTSFSDEQTSATIKEVYDKYGYLMDPHGAVGYLGLNNHLESSAKDAPGIFLETAHPAKFADIVEPIIGKKIELPKRLEECLHKEKHSTKIPSRLEALKSVLLS